MITHRFENDDVVIECVVDDRTAKMVVKKLLSWFNEYGHTGECICQSDDAQINSISVLAEIADDILKFKVVEHK